MVFWPTPMVKRVRLGLLASLVVLLCGGCGGRPPAGGDSAATQAYKDWLQHSRATARDSRSRNTADHLTGVLQAVTNLDYAELERITPSLHIQHNPMLGGDRHSLLELAAAEEGPRGGAPRLMEHVAHLLIDGEMAVIHRRGRLGPLYSLNFDVLRIDARGDYQEHWSFLQPVEGGFFDSIFFSFVVPRQLDLIPMANTGDALLPLFNPEYADKLSVSAELTAANRALVAEYQAELDSGAEVEAVTAHYLAENFQLHIPGVPPGRQAMADILKRASRRVDVVHHEMTLAQNDLVWVLTRVAEIREQDVPELASADLFRVRGNRIVEQWKIVQPSPRFSRNNHGLF
jgi:predicted SnoaL-like aldol condensation-catalyzing enzyme